MTSDATHSVVWAEPAATDLAELVAYLAMEAPLNARRVLDRIRNRASTLDTTPHRGRWVPELRALGVSDVRELVIKPYRLVYRISGKQVIVLAVLDGRRDLDDVLYERLIRPLPDDRSSM